MQTNLFTYSFEEIQANAYANPVALGLAVLAGLIQVVALVYFHAPDVANVADNSIMDIVGLIGDETPATLQMLREAVTDAPTDRIAAIYHDNLFLLQRVHESLEVGSDKLAKFLETFTYEDVVLTIQYGDMIEKFEAVKEEYYNILQIMEDALQIEAEARVVMMYDSPFE